MGEETIQLLREDSWQRVMIKACAVLLVRSSCCADVSVVICMRRIRYRQVDICNAMHDRKSEALANLVPKRCEGCHGYCTGNVYVFI